MFSPLSEVAVNAPASLVDKVRVTETVSAVPSSEEAITVSTSVITISSTSTEASSQQRRAIESVLVAVGASFTGVTSKVSVPVISSPSASVMLTSAVMSKSWLVEGSNAIAANAVVAVSSDTAEIDHTPVEDRSFHLRCPLSSHSAPESDKVTVTVTFSAVAPSEDATMVSTLVITLSSIATEESPSV